MVKSTRVLFNNTYYTLQAILASEKFQTMFDKFRQEMKSKGFPIPEGGFKTAEEYHKWSDKTHKKDIYFESFIEKVIKEFKIENEKEKIQLGLQWFVYFGKKVAPVEPTYKKLASLSSDGNTINVSLTIYPWTIKDDITNDLWNQVEYLQKQLFEKSNLRNREWDTFERDFKIYELYLKLKGESPKSVYKRLVEDPEFEKIAKKYKAGSSFDETIGTIVSRFGKKIHKISLI